MHDIEAILHDGPIDLPVESRHRIVSPDSLKIKVPYLSGYEHFERSGEPDEKHRVPFRWTTRTRIAE